MRLVQQDRSNSVDVRTRAFGSVYAERAVRLTGYTATASLALATAAEAQEEFFFRYGDVVFQFAAINIDLNNDGAQDLRIKNYVFGGGNYQGAEVIYAPGQLAGFYAGPSNFFYASLLNEGDPINASTVGPGTVASMSYGASNPNGQWDNVTEGYMGLSFDNMDDTLFYAWVRISVDNATGFVQIVDSFASSDPNGIVAGQGPSILEGDYNGDGFVSQADLDLVLLNWGDSSIPQDWVATEQFDGVQVSQNELDGVLLNWGDGTPPDPGMVTAIPEPGSLAFLAAGAAGLGVMRRRRDRRS